MKELKGQEEEISHGGRLQDGHMIFLMWAGACVWVYHTGGGASSGLQRQTGLTSLVFLPVQVHTYTHAYVHLHTPNKHRHCLAVVVHIFFFFFSYLQQLECDFRRRSWICNLSVTHTGESV